MDLQQRCEQAFADHVDALFRQARARWIEKDGVANLKYLVLEAPYIKLLYSAVDDAFIPKLKRLVCAALAAREQFHRTKPSWAPDLPISCADCEKLQNSASRRMRQLGDYGTSLQQSQYDPAHPLFDAYCREGEKIWHDDETRDGWVEFLERLDAGIMHRGAVPAVNLLR